MVAGFAGAALVAGEDRGLTVLQRDLRCFGHRHPLALDQTSRPGNRRTRGDEVKRSGWTENRTCVLAGILALAVLAGGCGGISAQSTIPASVATTLPASAPSSAPSAHHKKKRKKPPTAAQLARESQSLKARQLALDLQTKHAGVEISRTGTGKSWPFTVESGILGCVGTPGVVRAS